MMVFAQNKALGDTFRETGIAFAYTISLEAGKKLEDLVNMTKDRRLNGSTRGKWRSGFEDFWREYGKEMMHKLSGMRDPMLNLMINAPETFQEMLDNMTGDEKKKYERVREKRGAIVGYHQRLKDTYDSPSHVHMDRGKGFYSGDHFRFRDFFNIGYPMAWVNWDAYWDANMDKNYSK
jgi:hypothetical protein